MFQSSPYPIRQRRASQSPPFFNFLDQSPYTPCYSLQPEASWGPYNGPHCQQSDNMYYPHHHDSQFLPNRHASNHQSRRSQQFRDPPHPLQLQRERELEAQRQREISRLRRGSEKHQDALRTERVRRLAEAQKKQRLNDEIKVQVDMPDGRTCVVPLSWAKKMQARYPSYLTNSMIRPLPARSPSPPLEHDEALVADADSDGHDSNFYVLDPSQDPKIDVLPTPIGAPEVPPKPKHSHEEMDAAARLIQHQFRLHRRLHNLSNVEAKFRALVDGFTYPSPLDLKFMETPSETVSGNSLPNTKLAFNHPINCHVQAYEESLLQLQIELDAVVSGGEEKIKSRRRSLVKMVEGELEKLDRFKTEAWRAQCLAQQRPALEESSHPTVEVPGVDRLAAQCPEVDMVEDGDMSKQCPVVEMSEA